MTETGAEIGDWTLSTTYEVKASGPVASTDKAETDAKADDAESAEKADDAAKSEGTDEAKGDGTQAAEAQADEAGTKVATDADGTAADATTTGADGTATGATNNGSTADATTTSVTNTTSATTTTGTAEDSKSAQVTVSDGTTAEVVVTNTYTSVVGEIAVKKVVASTRSEDRSKSFGFRLTVSGATLNGTYGDLEFKDSVANFTLKDGETRTAKDQPTGITYKVEETDNGGLTTSFKEVKGEDGTTAIVTCTNTYTPPTTPPTTPPSSSTTTTKSTTTTAKTGDATNALAVTVALATGTALVASAFVLRRRKKA